MQKRMTITLDETVYDGLMRVVGRGKVSQFLQSLAPTRAGRVYGRRLPRNAQ